jgi:hypothetical protein
MFTSFISQMKINTIFMKDYNRIIMNKDNPHTETNSMITYVITKRDYLAIKSGDFNISSDTAFKKLDYKDTNFKKISQSKKIPFNDSNHGSMKKPDNKKSRVFSMKGGGCGIRDVDPEDNGTCGGKSYE